MWFSRGAICGEKNQRGGFSCWSLVSYYCCHCNIYRIIQLQPDKVNVKALFGYFKNYKRTEYKKNPKQQDFMSKTFVSFVKEMSAEAELKLGLYISVIPVWTTRWCKVSGEDRGRDQNISARTKTHLIIFKMLPSGGERFTFNRRSLK